MSLADAPEGLACVIERIAEGARFEQRGASMGLVAGTKVSVVRNQRKMPLLVFARDTLIAINRKDAEGIEVVADA